jgi:hypothetical protein
MSTKRIGYVAIPICVQLPLNDPAEVTFASKRFEVMSMEHDFIFGVELLRELFPRDELLRRCGPHSSITDAPSATTVRAAHLHTARDSPYAVEEEMDETEDVPPVLTFKVAPHLLYDDAPRASAAAATHSQ